MILYVDDDFDDIEIFCDALRSVNPTAICLIARNGQEALTLLEKRAQKPDCVFLDINMPVMNGKRCLAAIKGKPDLCHIPVIMHSTSGSPIEKNECFMLGASGFLIKHYEYNKLIKALRETLITLN